MRTRLASMTLLAALAAAPASAADFGALRGTSSPSLPPPPLMEVTPPANWDGFYIGGLGGYSSFGFNPSDAARNMVINRWRGTAIINQFNYQDLVRSNEFSRRGVSFGGFAGYNWAFGEAVLGVEADFMSIRRSGQGDASAPARIYQVGTNANTGASVWNQVEATGTTRARINELFTFRARAGYAMGALMPYVTGGLAIGYGSTNTTVTTNSLTYNCGGAQLPTNCPVSTPSPQTDVIDRKNSLMAGFTLGTGLEATFGGLLVRGEYLYTRLQSQGGIKVDINQVRAGAGVKF